MARLMRRLGALVLVGVVVTACSSPVPSATSAAAPLTAAPPSATPTSSPLPSLAPTGYVSLNARTEVVYTASPATYLVFGGRNDVTAELRVQSVTIAFDDGLTESATWDCSSAATERTISHAFAMAGVRTATVATASLCDATFEPDSAITSVLALPAAPPESASWPRCTASDLHLVGRVYGLALGNGGAIVSARNTGTRPCRLSGLPGLELVNAAGKVLPIRVSAATGGAYLFPELPEGRVALRPGEWAHVQIAFGNVSETAYPAATAMRVTDAGGHRLGTASFDIAPCGGWLTVSAWVPGKDWIEFQ